MHVCTYICVMKLEQALQTDKFENEQHKASLNVLYTSYWLRTHFSAVLKACDLTAEQFNVMRILKGKHPVAMCNKDIGSRMIEKSSNVPRIADRLVAKKLVKRTTSKEDKRETLLVLTDAGLELLKKANAASAAVQKKTIGLTDEEARQLNELMEKLRTTD